MNVISFSLYGAEPKYVIGMARNINLARRFYPSWQVRVYADQANETWLHKAARFNTYLDVCGFVPGIPPMMNRFLAVDDPKVNRVLIRDADSRISQREVDAVNAWIASGKTCSVLRDHHAHCLMPGGLIGFQPRYLMLSMERLILDFIAGTKMNPNEQGFDQVFLEQKVWPLVKDSVLIHDCMPGRRKESGAFPWPTQRIDHPRFVGEVICVDEQGRETPKDDDWRTLPVEE